MYHNKIIEFNGSYWHADPQLYDDNELVRENMLAKDIHDRDKIRLDELKNQGYDVLVVWESDYMLNKNATINECLKFLDIK